MPETVVLFAALPASISIGQTRVQAADVEAMCNFSEEAMTKILAMEPQDAIAAVRVMQGSRTSRIRIPDSMEAEIGGESKLVAKFHDVPKECATQMCAMLQDKTIGKFVALYLLGISATSIDIDSNYPFGTELLVADAVRKRSIDPDPHVPKEPRMLLSAFRSKTTLQGYVLARLTQEASNAESFRQECGLVSFCKHNFFNINSSEPTTLSVEPTTLSDSFMQKVGCAQVNDESNGATKYLSTTADSTAFLLITFDGDEGAHDLISWRFQHDIEKLAQNDLQLRPVLLASPLGDPLRVVRNMFVDISPASISGAISGAMRELNFLPPNAFQQQIVRLSETRVLHDALTQEIPGISQRGLVHKFLQDLTWGFWCPLDVGPQHLC